MKYYYICLSLLNVFDLKFQKISALTPNKDLVKIDFDKLTLKCGVSTVNTDKNTMKRFILSIFFIFLFSAVNAQTWHTLFFDDFNRSDGALGANYTIDPSDSIRQLDIFNNEVRVTSGMATAYWRVLYINGFTYDSIRISCKYRAPKKGYSFSINARDNGVDTYSAGIISNTDSIVIYNRDYIGNFTKLASAKAFLDSTKTYYMEFTVLSSNLTFKFAESGTLDTITITAIDNTLGGTNVNLSSYYYNPNLSVYFDDFKIESCSYAAGIENATASTFSMHPNPASDHVMLYVETAPNTDLTVTIYNAIGDLVKTEVLTDNTQPINISSLSNGMYLVEIKSKDWVGKEKLMIQR